MNLEYEMQDDDGVFQAVELDLKEVLYQAMDEDMRTAVGVMVEMFKDHHPILRARTRREDLLELSKILQDASK